MTTAPVVAFYGDSYTEGIGASAPERRWSSIICGGRGWNERNHSVNGLGFIRNRSEFGTGDTVQRCIEETPDLLFVTMGLNDNFAYPAAADAIRAQIEADLTRLRAALPATRIIAVEPFWYTDERPGSVDVIIEWVRAASLRIGADWIAGASRWVEGHPEWMAADGLHPNDAGYAAMAFRMDAALTALGIRSDGDKLDHRG